MPGSDPTAGARSGATARREAEGILPLEPGAERVREARREAVARAVRVDDLAGRVGRGVRPARARPTTQAAGGRDDELRLGIELAGLVSLGVVLPAPDQGVELHPAPSKHFELA